MKFHIAKEKFMRNRKLLKFVALTVILAFTLALPMNVFAATTKTTEVYDKFSGYHGDFGVQFWGVTTKLTGIFSTYIDEKVIEKVDVYADVLRHTNGVDEGSYSCTLFTYGGSTQIRTYYPPSGFTGNVYYMPTNKCLLMGLYKNINDSAIRTVTMKVKSNYSFWAQDTTPINSWNSTTQVLY